MRGELCIGFASFLSFVASLLLIFVHVGQISTATVPRGISMVKVNVSLYGQALFEAFGAKDPITGLYTANSSAPLQVGAGLRQEYQFGLYSHCGYVNNTAGICSNRTAARLFHPYDYIIADMGANYTSYSNSIIPFTTFRDSGYLGSGSKAAYYMLLMGSICAVVAFISGIPKHTVAFLLSTTMAVLSSILLLIGAAIWTVLIKKAEAINSFLITSGSTTVPLGIIVSSGPALYLMWAAAACMLVSIVPYMLSCCTYKG